MMVASPSLSGLEFSLRRPKWLKKLKVGRILGKAVKYGAIIGGAALLAPAAAGFAVRGASGLVKGAGLLRRVGGKVFRFTSGRTRGGLPGNALARARAMAFGQPAYRAPDFGSSYTPSATMSVPGASLELPASFASMSPSPARDSGGASQTEEESAPSQAGTGGINPALILGGLVIGGLVLASMSAKKRSS